MEALESAHQVRTIVLDKTGTVTTGRMSVAAILPAAEPEDKRIPVRYYESIDLYDAVNPQTILAYDMNDQPLPVANGAPLRVRIERYRRALDGCVQAGLLEPARLAAELRLFD